MSHIEGPSDLPRPALAETAKRVRLAFRNNNLTTLAAALTYFGVLAMVPGLAVLFTALGWFGKGISQKVVHQVNVVAPGSSGHFVGQLLHQAQAHKSGTGIMAIVGIIIAIWSASSYVNGFRHASNLIYGVGEGRPLWKTLALRMIVTLVAVVLLVLSALIVVVSGSIASEVGNALGVGHAAVIVWGVLKWPILFLIVSALLAILYWATPNAEQAGIRWISPGGLIATAGWIVVSILFALYITHFSSYDRTYGSLASIVVFLVWLWLSNLSVLLGAQINADLEHARATAAGLPEDVRPFVSPRDTRKLDAHDQREAADAESARQSYERPSASRTHRASMTNGAH
jgi:membrane protein